MDQIHTNFWHKRTTTNYLNWYHLLIYIEEFLNDISISTKRDIMTFWQIDYTLRSTENSHSNNVNY